MKSERSGEIYLCIAGHRFLILPENERIEQALLTRYQGFLSETGTSAAFKISCRRVNIEAGEVENQEPTLNQVNSQHYLLSQLRSTAEIGLQPGEACFKFNRIFKVGEFDYLLRICMAFLIHTAGGCLFHAAGVVRDLQGYIFFGPSGAGKTTVTQLSQGKLVLNDDLLVLLPHGHKWMAFSTPFSNETPEERSNLMMPVSGLYYLVKDRFVFVRTMSPGEAFGAVIAGVPVLPLLAQFDGLMERCLRICEDIPVFELHFRQDPSFWDVI